LYSLGPEEKLKFSFLQVEIHLALAKKSKLLWCAFARVFKGTVIVNISHCNLLEVDQYSFLLYTENILLAPFPASDFFNILFIHFLTKDASLQNHTNHLPQTQCMYIKW